MPPSCVAVETGVGAEELERRVVEAAVAWRANQIKVGRLFRRGDTICKEFKDLSLVDWRLTVELKELIDELMSSRK